MTALQYIKEFVKENCKKALKREERNTYSFELGNYKFRAFVDNKNTDKLVLVYHGFHIKGVSMYRLECICKALCSDTLRAFCKDGDSKEVGFMKSLHVRSKDDVNYAISEIIDNLKVLVEELDNQNKKTVKDDDTEILEDHDIEHTEDTHDNEFKYASCKTGLNAVAGMTSLKRQLMRDYVNLLKYSGLAQQFGITPPNGLLLYGPPGCGKTYIAEHLTEEIGMKYKIVSPSDLGSCYLHGSEEKIRSLFEDAKKNAPCMLIFDEFDALVPSRSSRSAEHRAEEINEFLVHLNNSSENGVYVIAMTNHPESIDKAVLRKGRLDKCIYVPTPDNETRKELFRMALTKCPCSKDINFEELADLTGHFTSSDISYIAKEAARKCFEKTLEERKRNKKRVNQEVLKEVISETIPSVSAKDARSYERAREELQDPVITKVGRKRIGF